MTSSIKIGFFSFALLVVHIQHCVRESHATETKNVEITIDTIYTTPPFDTKAFEANSLIARQVLITHCGSCHQSSLDSHKAGAIAVFDLDKNALWHEDLATHHLPGITNRLLNKNELTEEQKEAIAMFIELKETQLDH